MFQLTKQQQLELEAWKEMQDAKVLAMQREGYPSQEHAYYGCSGGAYTYSFTPTTLGLCVEVTNSVTKESIDLTDYSW